MRSCRFLLALAALSLCPALGGQTPGGGGFDPTGVWYGMHGPLALVRAGDTLTFSYSAVFGATGHTCDGIGVARRVGDGRWEHVDDAGTVTFTTTDGEVTVEATSGVASFCGAGWPGDRFGGDGWKPAFRCTVAAPKARFLTAAPSPEPRPAYVVQGDVVEAVGLVNEGTPAWLLARFVGPERTTAGLLERDDLECREE